MVSIPTLKQTLIHNYIQVLRLGRICLIVKSEEWERLFAGVGCFALLVRNNHKFDDYMDIQLCSLMF